MNAPKTTLTQAAFSPRARLPAAAGIYKITCSATNRVYIGASKTSVRARINSHRRDLLAGTHSNKDMQNDWAEHGEACFTFEIAELVPDAAELQAAENRIMEQFAASCYNRKPSNMGKVLATEKDSLRTRCSTNGALPYTLVRYKPWMPSGCTRCRQTWLARLQILALSCSGVPKSINPQRRT